MFEVADEFTVVAALAQLVVEHEPGVAGLLPPEASTEA
jgi:hypothetical protein